MTADADPPHRRRRVPAMPPEERRAALIAATLPLLREHGPEISTRQIASAAGVAEGTIFGVFPDKQSLIHAAVLSAFDPEPIERAMRSIDPADDLRTRLTQAAHIAAEHLRANGQLLSALRRAKDGHPPGHPPGPPPGPPPSPPPGKPGHAFFSRLSEARQRLVAAIASVVAADSDALRYSPTVGAELLLSILAMQGHGGAFTEIDGVTTDDVVTLLLDGLLTRPAQCHTGDPTTC
ncbi:MAG: TetR/AcrR family transcriptional regulator [Micromonosporaceae bacterium]|nr:TetR/AcrR family transcriptional regulator [Micromonosporaceae bacterium]